MYGTAYRRDRGEQSHMEGSYKMTEESTDKTMKRNRNFKKNDMGHDPPQGPVTDYKKVNLSTHYHRITAYFVMIIK